ncbi:MerR family transcriptional regulator [Pontibacter akesuensis]|uniref:B12 binding domain-containing protein n=1 Tax=Pontibacter akesuensis TaxID=388950 RepID=A0A1I7GYG7_9BACT|nr:MerR family transcriptional regulator [Pontibacter akesuensis]GHA54445.1 MerR family transcriptional regulator [Pontibacter akesuensis]SFU53472.1 B12 binding domain-containing protein [Pontibacter akesuensis]
MAQYTIKELEHLSGIKAHTIRIWEQRYSILNPKRTDTNIRFYDDEDLKSLLNISLLNDRGYKISKIAQMDSEQIQQKVQQLCDEPCVCSHQVSALVSAMIDMSEEKFDKALSTATIQMGFLNTMQDVVYPFLNKIGILWQTGNITPAHEHFVSNLIRQKLLVAIDGQPARWKDNADTFILYLPENELHELALLYMNYILRANRQRVIYLGQNLPFKDLELTHEQFKTAHICTAFTTSPERDQVQGYINKLSDRFTRSTIYVYGYQVHQEGLILPQNVVRIPCMADFIALFKG